MARSAGGGTCMELLAETTAVAVLTPNLPVSALSEVALMSDADGRHSDIALDEGSCVRVAAITPGVFRLRLRPDGRFPEPGLVRYGVVRSDLPPAAVEVAEDEQAVHLDTGEARLTVRRADGRMSLRDGQGNLLVQDAEAARSDPERGFCACFALRDDERLYGLGDETRDRLQKRGHRTRMVLRNVLLCNKQKI